MFKNLNYNKLKIDKNRDYKLGVLFTIIPVVLFAAILCNKTMPAAEGWYTYYAQLINNGQVVYKDFEYLFMPGYITFIALFTKIFGYSIIALRILGVIFFTIIAYLAYRIFNELFNPIAACMGALVTAFYLQSEVVQIFYDYIRMMDIFAYLTIFLLIKMGKSFIAKEKPDIKITLLAGFSNAMVLMVKQNIGLLFGFFVLIYFIFLFVYEKDKKTVFLNLLYYGCGAAIVFAGYGIYLLANGALGACLSQTLFGAVGAKGGVKTILFKWIIDGKDDFIGELGVAGVAAGALFLLFILRKVYPGDKDESKAQRIVLIVFGAIAIIGILILSKVQKISEMLTDIYKSKTYGFYVFATVVFFIMMIMYAVDIFCKKKHFEEYIGFFLLFGAIFTIGYGVGMSGSLAASQIALSTGVIICLLVSLCTNKYSWISMSLVGVVAMCFIMFCSAFKMVNTYSWWGLTDSSIWESTETTNVSILKGIKMSEEDKKLYEGIVNDIDSNTTKDDSIFVFPHTPILYTAADRMDPGSFTKVQWYDVSTNDSVQKDIETITKAEPKAIVIYNIPEFAIEGHESSFNNNKESATTKMMKALRTFCIRNNYSAVNNYEINNKCSISVFIKSDKYLNWNNGGTGKKSDPFKINNTEQFLNFAKMVNGGASFKGLNVELTSDIDLSGCKDFEPIGNEINGASFDGTFNGNGYVIKNLTVDKRMPENEKKKKNNKKNKVEKNKYDFALFGTLNGKVVNLGIENFNVKGFCVAGLVRHSATNGSSIVNCYIKNSNITGQYRSGAMADDFDGFIYNSVADNVSLVAPKNVGFVSYKKAEFTLENCYTNTKYYHDTFSIRVSNKEMNSKDFSDELNENVLAYESKFEAAGMNLVELNNWKSKTIDIHTNK